MGDRLQQTVNGNTTTYALDINTSLPEVLSDGQFTYLYGLDNIAQVNAGGTQYFLGDALNSTRQLTDASAQITLAQSYDPFGSVTLSAGNGQSVYGYTSEQADASGLMYLRARYYSPNAGRFTSKDTWAGNTSQPLSLNQWNYVNGNPINYTDPTGQFRWSCNTDAKRIATAKNAVPISNIDPLNTYTATGIAVQCLGGDITWPWNDINYSGLGIAQITQKEAETAYGEPIYEYDSNGNKKYVRENGAIKLDANGNPIPIIRGYGLCDGNYTYKPEDKDWSAEFMRRRIQMVVDKCKFCTARDTFLVAALAQNGPGFTIANIEAIKHNYLFNNQIQWKIWYADRSRESKNEYRTQWRLFYKFAKKLNDDGYYLPPNILNDEIIIWLKSQ